MELHVEPDSAVVTPRSGRKKKSALLLRLAQKKKDNISDDSDFGSHCSLQDEKEDLNSRSLSNNNKHQKVARPSITPRLKQVREAPPESTVSIDDKVGQNLEFDNTERFKNDDKVQLDDNSQRFHILNLSSDLPDIDSVSNSHVLKISPKEDKSFHEQESSVEKLVSNDERRGKGTKQPIPASRNQLHNTSELTESNKASKDNMNSILFSGSVEHYNSDNDLAEELKLNLSQGSNPESTKESDDADSDLNSTKADMHAEYANILTSTPRRITDLPPKSLSEKSQVAGVSTLQTLDMDASLGSYQHSQSRADRASQALFSSFANSASEMGSIQSFKSQSSLPLMTTKQARERSFLVGSINKSLLGSGELERCFPDRKIRVFSATWNMCGVQPKQLPGSLNDFLLPENIDYVPDLVAVGTQETCTDRHEWEVKIQETLGPTHVMIHSVQHGSLHQCVFIKRDLVWYCSIAEDACLTTRKAIRTKGCVGISFSVFGTSFLFLTSHFKHDPKDFVTSDDGRLKERVEDYNKTIKNLELPKKIILNEYQAKADDVTARFDCVFWAGDMNFRIERPRHIVDSVMNAIAQKEHPNFEDLLVGDELYKAKMEGTAFQEFQEGRINFAPTYKFDIGTDNYDTSPTLRIPSYCDRVLFRCRKKHGIVCHYYDSVNSIKISDHRPVYGLYEVDLKPGRDSIPLSGGAFNRGTFMEANSRRAKIETSVKKSDQASTVCTIQ